MTGDNGSNDHRIRDWLLAEAPTDVPDVVLRTALDRVRVTERPHALVRRFASMNRLLPVGVAAGFVVIAAIALIPRAGSPGVGAVPTASPSSSIAPSPSASPSSTAAPSASLQAITAEGQLAYVSETDGNAEIYLANLDRSGAVRLTSDPAPDRVPAWWPDGSRLVFARGPESNSDLWTMDADGANQRQLTSSPGVETEPAVSPDGARIAYRSGSDGPSIRVMNADGTEDIEVLSGPGHVGNPHWTADGTSLLVNVDVSSGGRITVSRLDLETLELTTVVGGGGDNSGNAISPDGSRIAFQGDRTPGGLCTAAIDGRDITHLVGNADGGHAVTWSSDGAWIVYQKPADSELYIIASDGG
ncbi:MAG: hypothetical protein ABWZ99_11465, partial [Ilumatobacteraceae bacterium]